MAEVYGASDALIGYATLAMGLAMVIGSFLVGPATRLARSVRWLALIVNGGAVLVMAGAVARARCRHYPLDRDAGADRVGRRIIHRGSGPWPRLLPPHLVGRGVTFLNMFSIGGAAVLQFASRPIYRAASAGGTPPEAYSTLFLFFPDSAYGGVSAVFPDARDT